jgi:hypothetical protein
MKIPVGNTVRELLKMKKEAKSWDPDGQMPWSKTTYINNGGKKYKVVVTLNKEETSNANI